MAENHRHAIVYGASGLIGWALVDQLLSSYPDVGSFAKITAVTNRPLDVSRCFWPESATDKPQLQLVSNINIHNGDGTTLADSLKESVNDVEGVTHIYYLAFAARENDVEEVQTNRQMLQNVIDAHCLISPNLQFVVFPGGTRGYGIYLPGGVFTPPLHEDMVNNLPAEYAKTVPYPSYRELLRAASKGKKWTWCEVCPDTIIGFTPNGSQFSLALHWAQYLSLYAYNHGIGPHTGDSNEFRVEVPFPGNEAGANSLSSPVFSKTLARFMIYASLHPEKCGDGQLFNVADSEQPVRFHDTWPRLAEWFGLAGIGPVEMSQSQKDALRVGELPESTASLPPGKYIAKYKDVFAQCGCSNAADCGVSAGNVQLDSVGY